MARLDQGGVEKAEAEWQAENLRFLQESLDEAREEGLQLAWRNAIQTVRNLISGGAPVRATVLPEFDGSLKGMKEAKRGRMTITEIRTEQKQIRRLLEDWEEKHG